MNRLCLSAAAAVVIFGLAACSGSPKLTQYPAPPPTYPPSAPASSAVGAGIVTVCVKPYARSQCAGNEQEQPQSIVLSPDGSVALGSIAWTGWGTATATGRGLVYSQDCKPSCAQATRGAASKAQVTITLTGLRAWQSGKAYDDMTVAGIPAPYTQQYSSFTGLAP